MRYLFIIILFLAVQPLSAITLPELNTLNDVVLTTEPKYPKPDESIVASLQSYSHNLQGIDIQWYSNGELLEEGLGLTTISTKAPKLGESIELSANIKDLTIIRRTITPITIDILWEADTYTHNNYLGRALPVDGSRIKAIVIPNIGKSNININKLIYNWYKDGKFLIKDSGVNKNHIITDSPSIYSKYNLNVEITDLNGVPLGRSGVIISSTDPELILYSSSPLLGINYHSSLSNSKYDLEQKEGGIIAMPYYFNIINPNSLRYKWKSYNMNITQDSDSEPQSITVLETLINSTLSVSARHRDILLQSAKSSYSANTNSKQRNNNQEDYTSPFGNPDNI